MSEHEALVSWQQPSNIGTNTELEEYVVEYLAAGSSSPGRVVVRDGEECLLTDLVMDTSYSVKVMVRIQDIAIFTLLTCIEGDYIQE